MIDGCYRMIQRHWKKKERLAVYRIMKLFLNLCYPLYTRLTAPKGVDGASQVIVSLTSFPARIGKVYLTVETLLRQTVRPQKVVLWLADSQFPGRELPPRLRRLERYGLEIRWCEDLRSHKKYYESLREYPECTLVTADDDTFYPESWLRDLTETAARWPNTVVCMLATEMRFADGRPLPYVQWPYMTEALTAPRMDLLPIGCEGVLYPPHILHPDVLDKDFFMAACRNADDLWLRAMSLRNGIRVMTANPAPFTYVNQLTANIGALNAANVGENQNDVQLERILARYPNLFQPFFREE